MKRILVTGASGMLGSNLALALSTKHKVFGTGSSKILLPFNYKVFDLSNKSYNELIDWSKPELIIHCAAKTDVNYCQQNSLDAYIINGLSTEKLISSTDKNVKIIYISSDAIFPSNIHMAKEGDYKSPTNIYGKSKELGEYFLLNSNRESIIIRTTIVGFNKYSEKKGFVKWILSSSKEKKTISLFDDVQFTPISVWDFIFELDFLIDQNSYETKVFHISGSEVCSKYEFGMELFKKLSLNTRYLKKGYIKAYKDWANRSNDQTLNSSFYEKKYNRKLPKLSDTIDSIKKNL